MIDTNGLAKKLADIHPSYIKKAIKIGQLEAGVHYMTLGGSEPIFEWTPELKKKLFDSCKTKPEPRIQKPKTTDEAKINLESLGLAHLDPSKPKS
jgi:hypothetical protein